jgi:hypothetical protein
MFGKLLLNAKRELADLEIQEMPCQKVQESIMPILLLLSSTSDVQDRYTMVFLMERS